MKEHWDWPAIGIDLGTRSSSVAVWQNDQVEVIMNDQGNRKTPSIVAFTEKEILIGEAAKNQVVSNPANTIFDVNKLIGRRYGDLSVQNGIMSWPFKVIAGCGNDKPKFVVSYKGKENQFTAEEICSMIIMKMKETAESYLHAKVKHAVITVPTYFNDFQRQAIKDAGLMAGLNTVRVISEPTAAVVAYGFYEQPSGFRGSNVLVFDMGGAALDVSLLTINEDTVEFKAISGHSQFGGDDFDKKLASNYDRLCNRNYGRGGFGENPKNLIASCERAKRILSNCTAVTVGTHNNSRLTISRPLFESLGEDLFKECMQHVEKCLRSAKTERSDVNYVILVGGSTRIPKVQHMLQNFFFHGTKLLNTINAEEVVAYGAALHAAMLSRVYASPTVPLTELHFVQESSSSFVLEGIDSLLKDLASYKKCKNNSTSFSSLKDQLLELLEEVRCKPDDVKLTQQVSQSLADLYPYLPNHLLTVVKSIEKDLLAAQHQLLECSSKEVAISLNLEATDTIESNLASIKTKILQQTSSRDHLRSKINGVDKKIAKLMASKSDLEKRLSLAEKDIHKLTRSVDPQVDLARQKSAQLAQLEEASNLKAKATVSIEATLNSFASYFRNL